MCGTYRRYIKYQDFKYHQSQEGSQATIPKTWTGNVFSHQVELQIWEKINFFYDDIEFQNIFHQWTVPEKAHLHRKLTLPPPLDIVYKFKTLFRHPPPLWMAEISSVCGLWGFFGTTQYCKVAVKYLHNKITNLLCYN